MRPRIDLAGISSRGSWADLRFIVAGNGRGILALFALAVVTAGTEVFLLGALVQGASALSSHAPTVDLQVGTWSTRIGIEVFLAAAVAAAVVRAGCAAASAVLGPRVTGASRERHRRQLLDAYLSSTWTAQAADRTGRLQQTFSTSVNEVNAIVLVATIAMTAFVTLVALVAVAMVLSAPITGVLLVAGVVIHLALRPLSGRSRLAAGVDADTRLAAAAHVSAVAAAGAEILVLGATDAAASTGRRLIGTAEAAFARSNSLRQLGVTSVQSLAFVVAAAGLLSVAVFDLPVDFTVLGTVALLLLRAAGLANQVQASVGLFGQLSPFISQVREMTATFGAERRTAGTSPFPADFEIALDGVRYVYPETTSAVLDIDAAVIEQGTSVAVLGPSGSGKSTLIQLLLCLRNPTAGHVRVGGLDARSIRPEEFSRRVSFVPQAPHLIPGTVRENIRFFREWVTDAQIESCARLAHVHDEITRMPAGYETRLDAHVDMLSGGQKQRLSMARALVADPSILVLDEPTSALDPVNERLVVQTLAAMRGERTVIIITHRESTVAGCDVVMSLAEGRLTVLDGDRAAHPPLDPPGAPASGDAAGVRPG